MNVTTYNIPTLDLSDTPVTVVYDKKVATYPASYVSLYYPAALSMGMMNATIKGPVPPMWMVPESARDSVLMSKMNVAALDGTTAWPVSSHPFHPEDKGVTLTTASGKPVGADDVRQMLIRTADLGGQYWSRQNTGFVPYNNDPTLAQKY
jgi:hypothetical protein